MDEFDANTTPNEELNSEEHHDGSSRRSFLKAAVVGSAAAVAVSGVGAATLTLTGRHTGLRRFVTLGATISGLTSNACTTNTADTPVDQTAFNKQESIYFWAKFNNVPAGTYTLDITPTINGTSLVDYQSSSSNNVNVYKYTPGSSEANFDCEPPSLTGLPTAIASAGSLPITFTTSAAEDILLQVHLQGQGTAGTVTLTAKLYQGTGTGGTLEASAAAAAITIA